METKFKPKCWINETLVFGVYYKSENDVITQYLIQLCEGQFEGNALVKIYTTEVLENYFNTDGLEKGSIIGLDENTIEWIAEVDLCGKYFFPKFNNELQLYYDEEKYYDGKYKSNSITSLMECINYAIEYGLKQSNIKPY